MQMSPKNDTTPGSAAIGTLVIAGLGLLGGSVAMAARAAGLATHIIAVGRRDLTEAVEAGVVDEATRDLEGAVRRADFIILGAPVETIREQISLVMRNAPAGAIVTDVGSTKQRLVAEAEAVDSDAHFVGSHPMVGSHLTGWKHGRPSLFENGIVYTTPTMKTDLLAAARVGRFWQALGAKSVFVDPRRHDYLCALLSHVPHLAAVTLVEHLRQSREDVNLIKYLAGNGLRDTTRIAAGSPQVWAEICEHNSEAIALLLERFSQLSGELARAVRARDAAALNRVLEDASSLRNKL